MINFTNYKSECDNINPQMNNKLITNFFELYNQLNNEQKKAVDMIDGPVMILAGPGTGKTQVLALRIVNILRQTDVEPNDILCLTFQDASVQAMRNRLIRFLGNDAYRINIHTFHSFCNDVIRTYPDIFNFNLNVSTISDVDKLDIFRDIILNNKLDQLQFTNDILGYFSSLVRTISNLKKEYITPAKLKEIIQIWAQGDQDVELRKLERMNQLVIFYEEYLRIMKERSLIDFDDMIYYVTEEFTKNDELVRIYQENFLYTLVDEFQDTNNAQLEVIKHVANYEGLNSNIFVVGDDDQTIFRFQGASLSNFSSFLEIFPDTEIIVLKTNYRSGQQIIDVSENVIKNNEPFRLVNNDFLKSRNLDKNFVSGRGLDSRVSVHEFNNALHEDYFIASSIKSLIDSGVDPNEIAIITRNNRQISNITGFLDAFRIKYKIKKSNNLLDDNFILDIITIFKAINDPKLLFDDRFMWDFCNVKFWDLNIYDLLAQMHKSRESNKSFYELIKNSNDILYIKFKGVLDEIVNLSKKISEFSVENIFIKMINKLGILEYLGKIDDSHLYLHKIGIFYQYIQSRQKFYQTYFGNKYSYILQKLISDLDNMQKREVIIPIDISDVEQMDGINVITAHSSKGLEFEYVFLYQCIENNWEKVQGRVDPFKSPLFNNLIPSELNEKEYDERRLFYVACTRAKNELIITFANKYPASSSGELDWKEKNVSKYVLETNIEKFIRHDELIDQDEKINQILLSDIDDVVFDDNTKQYLSNIIQSNFTLSFTGLKKYSDYCKYKFLLENIFKVPTPTSAELLIGTFVHEGVENIIKYGVNNENTLDNLIKKILEKAEQEYHSSDFIFEVSLDKIKDKISKSIKAYFEYYQNNFSLRVYSIETNIKAWFENIPINGRVDMIGFEQGAYVISDFKTISKIPSIGDFLDINKTSQNQHLQQLLFYKLLIEKCSYQNIKLLKNKIKSLRIEYIDTTEYRVIPFEIPASGIYEYRKRVNSKETSEFDLDQVYEELKNSIKDVYNSIVALDFRKTDDLSKCEKCPFRKHCRR